MKYKFIYETINKINGKKYRGFHRTNDLNDGYLGSGTLLRRAIKKYGVENFSRTILEFAKTNEELYDLEKKYVGKNWTTDRNTYNIKRGGYGGWGGYSKKRRSEIMKERWENPIYREAHRERMKNRWKDPEYIEFQKTHPSMKNRCGENNPYAKPVEVDGIFFSTKSGAAKHFGVSITTISRWIDKGRGNECQKI